ncbi:MAG: hypothetical protein LBI94_08690 [Treponema sp.]|jgi:hypothetical protein|nr:hypothetical protein [Treponema sp.]
MLVSILMKNIARLVLFFTLSFAGIFVFTATIRFLHMRIDVIRVLPPQNSRVETELLAAARWALSLSLYSSLLLSLSYTARRRIFAPAAMLCLFILASAASLGITIGAGRLSRLSSSVIPARPLGNPGLILTQADNAMVLIQNPAEEWGSRVVSIPGQPLIYQEVPRGPDNQPISLPPIPFRTDAAWVFQSIDIDFSLASGQLGRRFDSPGSGIIPFMAYICALVFLLVSLRFVLGLSKWPLANLFLGALVFRGILSLETFLITPEFQEILNNFLEDLIPPSYTIPLIFVFLGFFVCLYTVLSYLVRRKELKETL